MEVPDPGVWLRGHQSYAALDEYLRWDDSVGRRREFANILSHLDHVYTRHGTGKSLLRKVFDTLACDPGKDMPFASRGTNRAISEVATKGLCSRLRIRVDSCYVYKEMSSTRLKIFITGILHNSHAENKKPWSISPSMVKHITFYQDPHPIHCGQHSMRGRIMNHYLALLYAHRKADAGGMGRRYFKTMAKDLADAKARELWTLDEGVVIDISWHILAFLQEMPNLLSFEWLSDVPITNYLFGVLATSCRKLTRLNVSIRSILSDERIEDFILTADKGHPPLRYSQLPAYSKSSLRLDDKCSINIRLKPPSDEGIICGLNFIARWTTKLATLEIDRDQSNAGEDLLAQGPDVKNPEDLRGYLTAPHRNFFQLHDLKLLSVGKVSKVFMPLFDPKTLQSLHIVRCEHLNHILRPLISQATNLVECSFHFLTESSPKDRAVSYWQAHVQDIRHAFDFLRRGTFKLNSLYIAVDDPICDEDRVPRELSLLGTDLFFAIQSQCPSLIRLFVLNQYFDFTCEELEEIGRFSSNLTQLGICCRMGGLSEENEADNEGLGWTLGRALLSFRRSTKPLALTILRTSTGKVKDSAPLGYSRGRPAHVDQFWRIWRGVQNALTHGVPIVLFAYHGEWVGGERHNFYAVCGVKPSPSRNGDLSTGRAKLEVIELRGGRPSTDWRTLYSDFLDEIQRYPSIMRVDGPPPFQRSTEVADEESRAIQLRQDFEHIGHNAGSFGEPLWEGAMRVDKLRCSYGRISNHHRPVPIPRGVADLDNHPKLPRYQPSLHPERKHVYSNHPICKIGDRYSMVGWDGHAMIRRGCRFPFCWTDSPNPLPGDDPRAGQAVNKINRNLQKEWAVKYWNPIKFPRQTPLEFVAPWRHPRSVEVQEWGIDEPEKNGYDWKIPYLVPLVVVSVDAMEGVQGMVH